MTETTPEPLDGTQTTKLLPNDGDAEDRFGRSVAVSDDGSTAVVSASMDEDPHGDDAGSAYVFERTDGTWSQQAKLVPSDGELQDRFGESVAMSADGNTILVCALVDKHPHLDYVGSTYVFERTDGTWTRQTKLTIADDEEVGWFADAVAISGDGDTALVSAIVHDPYAEDYLGWVYAFERSDGAWTNQEKLTADDAEAGDKFGNSVSLSADGATALVGAHEDQDPNGPNAGSAYVFERTDEAWTQRAKLVAEDGDERDYFGSAVALAEDGRAAIVGATGDDDPEGFDSGATYVFEQSDRSWTQQTKLARSESDTGDRTGGYSVSMASNGRTALVGSPFGEEPNEDASGSVIVFERSAGTWRQRDRLVAEDGDERDRFGHSVALAGHGSTALIGAIEDEDPHGYYAGAAYVFD
jgi:hypothetical protein